MSLRKPSSHVKSLPQFQGGGHKTEIIPLPTSSRVEYKTCGLGMYRQLSTVYDFQAWHPLLKARWTIGE